MAKIIKAKLILERCQAGDSIKDIANKYHVAKKSIITVCNSESSDATQPVNYINPASPRTGR